MQNYHEFTKNGYRKLLETALSSGYAFLPFSDKERFSKGKVCLLRHDVDADLNSALELARIETELGIRSTFFIMLRSPVYNLFSWSNHKIVEEISRHHWIGLHFDDGATQHGNEQLEDRAWNEMGILSSMFGLTIDAISFHQPSQYVLSNNIAIKGVINTYNNNDMRGYHYVSDSNKVWKSINPLDIFRDSIFSKLHLLIHPIWWATDKAGLSTADAWDSAILKTIKATANYLHATEGAYGCKRRFHITRDFIDET